MMMMMMMKGKSDKSLLCLLCPVALQIPFQRRNRLVAKLLRTRWRQASWQQVGSFSVYGEVSGKLE